MKAFGIAVISLLFATLLYAGPTAALDGMAGIPFGSTADQVKAAMDARGAVLESGSSGEHLHFRGGSFNNDPAGSWHFYFADGKLYKASVNISPPDVQYIPTYNRIAKAISDKYGP